MKDLHELLNRSVILIDKPKGPTSFDIVEAVSKALDVKKAGHTGTLDPNATGLMVIALGEARKAMSVLTGMHKEYIGTMSIHEDVGKETVEKALNEFQGKITQMPPVRSAVARKERVREVFEIELIDKNERNVRFRVLCEAGTYMRKIAHDAGEKMGTGAHLSELRRTKVGPFSTEHSVSPDSLKDMPEDKLRGLLIPIEDALRRLKIPSLTIKNDSVSKIMNGAPVRKDDITGASGNVEEGSCITVFSEEGKLVCLARYIKNGDTVARTDRVFL
ncbi:MAG: RNA-guided pseudouridylation complex pseudouridine synthase subunit Cbf5 [Candidatus Aenigmarchaeota archaeon]|nr:RNA-guided pseudouridylation complex pseudouridine synthase subunit Cbf5 [Candidatus Aenigmarchaeota archaeon]